MPVVFRGLRASWDTAVRFKHPALLLVLPSFEGLTEAGRTIPPSDWGGSAVCFSEELWEPGLPGGKVRKCVGQEHRAGEEHNWCLELRRSLLCCGCCAVTAAFTVSPPCCGSVPWTLIDQCLPGSVNSLEKPQRFWKACDRWPKHSPALWESPWSRALSSACATEVLLPLKLPRLYWGLLGETGKRERSTKAYHYF